MHLQYFAIEKCPNIKGFFSYFTLKLALSIVCLEKKMQVVVNSLSHGLCSGHLEAYLAFEEQL